MPKTEGFVPLSHKDVGQISEAQTRAGSQTFIRHVSSEADIKDCAGISTGHAHAGKKMLKNMVFIKKVSIFREVWFSADEKERKKNESSTRDPKLQHYLYCC